MVKMSRLPDLDDFLPEPTPEVKVAAPPQPSTRLDESPTSPPNFVTNEPPQLPAAPPQVVGILNPFDGEVIDLNAAESMDVDALLTLYERLDRINKQAYSVMIRVREKLASMTEGDAATRRVRGVRRVAKVAMPSVSFESAALKSLWNEFPDLREQVLKIESIGVQMREYAKLVNTSSDDARFVEFRDKLTKACRGRVGTPSITIEV